MKFTENEIELIRKFYPTKGSKYVARLLGRNHRNIICKASKMGIKLDKSSDFFFEFHKKSNLTRTGRKNPKSSQSLRNKYQRGEIKINRFKKHGLWQDKCYPTWNTMMNRCYNPKNKSFIHYGLRGIIVCEEWKNINNFKKWFDENHKLGMSIDRINVNGNYEPSNCKFSTPAQQIRNRRNAKINNFIVRLVKTLNIDGIPQNKIADILNMNKMTVNNLITKKRWSDVSINNYTPSINSSAEVSKTSSLGAEPREYAH